MGTGISDCCGHFRALLVALRATRGVLRAGRRLLITDTLDFPLPVNLVLAAVRNLDNIKHVHHVTAPTLRRAACQAL